MNRAEPCAVTGDKIVAWNLLQKIGLAGYKTFPEFVKAERDRYVDGFIAARDALSQSLRAPAAELLISINSEIIQYTYRYLRVDLMHKDEAGTSRPIALQDDPKKGNFRTFEFNGLMIEAHPFVWCNSVLRFNAALTDLNAVEQWMTKTLDVTDSNVPGPKNERLAAHSFTPIKSIGNWLELEIDFGTARSESLIELIQLLAFQGSTKFVLQ